MVRAGARYAARMREIYLDANASSPLRPEARSAVLAALDLGPGNASSPHGAGRRLKKALGDARDAVAALVGARPGEVVFTSGATESNHLAIRGALDAAPGTLVTTRAEHASVARLADRIEASGAHVRRAGVDRWGRFDAGEIAHLAQGAAVAALTLAQSVTGAVEPVAEAAGRLRGCVLHVDAAQALGRIPVDVRTLGASTLALSGHKLGGPQGIGALVVREGAAWRNPCGEAAQEFGMRAGTEAVALAAGFGAAAAVALARGNEEQRRMAELIAVAAAAVAAIPGYEILSPAAGSLPNTLLVAFAGCGGEAIMAALDARGVRVSTGSACASGARVPAEVLLFGGRDRAAAARAIRISASFRTDEDDILALTGVLAGIVARVRAAGPTS